MTTVVGVPKHVTQEKTNKPKPPNFYLLSLQKLNVKYKTKTQTLASFNSFPSSSWRKAKLNNQTNSCYSTCHLLNCCEYKTLRLTQQSTGSLALDNCSTENLKKNAYN